MPRKSRRHVARKPPRLRHILVAGDINLDYNVYLRSDVPEIADRLPQTHFEGSLGGACMIDALLREVAKRLDKDRSFQVALGAATRTIRPTSSDTAWIWEPVPVGALSTKKHMKVWRIARSRPLRGAFNLAKLPLRRASLFSKELANADLVVFEDNGGEFRREWAMQWRQSLRKGSHKARWIILKMTDPVCEGGPWEFLSSHREIADRLIVVLSADDLRRRNVLISKGISWERTAFEAAREITTSPSLAGLSKARHVIVMFGVEAALWLRRDAREMAFRLIFDPQHMEGEWSIARDVKGDVYGYASCFTAALAARLAFSNDFRGKPDMELGMERGLQTSRLLRLFGHGISHERVPKPSFEELARAMADDEIGADNENVPNLSARDAGIFGRASFQAEDAIMQYDRADQPKRARLTTFLEDADLDIGREKKDPLFGLARRIAIYGVRALRNAPIARFHDVLTADRAEIEALRNIRRLIIDYREEKSGAKPLSLAIFGPPGAGKSFGIKNIAKEFKLPVLEFNLSQFSNTSDLIGAFHRVRDEVLKGNLPVAFWDEFDSKSYDWLQYLLAPMQDGAFQEGQVTHPIGKCIFAFAGATSFDMENFGPLERDAPEWEKFKRLKGPDFKSRLHGFLNVLGPNRRRICRTSKRERKWREDDSDVCFPVRRAILLRSTLGLSGARENEILKIDKGLLEALLRISNYKHGARSMEKIVLALKNGGDASIHRSILPSDEIMAMNVDVKEFRMEMDLGMKSHLKSQANLRKRVKEIEKKIAAKLAPVIHEDWRKNKKRKMKTFPNDVSFSKLPQEVKDTNMAAAMRIPKVLELAELFLVLKNKSSPGDPKVIASILESMIDALAEKEHNLWMAHLLENGWRYGRKRDDQQHIHPSLVPFDELDKDTQDYDRNQVRKYPKYADLAGFTIVAAKPRAAERPRKKKTPRRARA